MLELDRRTWLTLLPALAAVGAIAPDAVEAQQPATAEAPMRVTKEMLDQAMRMAGLTFTSEQLDMMLPGVNRNLGSYESLRKVSVPLDTEPAFQFRPLLPGRPLPKGPARFHPSVARHVPAWRNPEELAFLPVTQLSSLIRAQRITPTELTKMYLERLKTYGPQLLCVITLTENLALEQAERATKEIRAGRHRGPLHGIPYGAKDLFATKGIPTTWGAEPYRDQVFDYNATVIDRMEKAGAILLAKLSMGALAQGGLWFGGMTKTPWDLQQTSSGSSAGSASATAAGLVGFALGTETLGSIVSPSVRCGCSGMRPTYGRVSRFGAMGLSWTMDKIGPICRTMEDCALVLQALVGSDGKDGSVVDAPLHWEPHHPVSTLKVGVLQADFDRMEKPQKDVYDAALAALSKTGVKLEPAKLPEFSAGALRNILVAEAATAFDDLTREGGVDQLKGQSANDWPNSFRTSRTIPAVEYLRAQRARTLLMRAMDKTMRDWDVLISPPASPSLTATNLTGHPQAVVKCGFLNGLPQGLLFTGRLYEEGTPMRLAHAFEQATDWHKQHPKLSPTGVTPA